MSELQAAIALTQWQKREAIYAAQRRNSQIVLSAVNQSPILRLLKGRDDCDGSLVSGAFGCPQTVFGRCRVALQADIIRTLYTDGNALSVACESFTVVLNVQTGVQIDISPCNASLNEKQMKHIARTIEIASQAISRMTEHRKDNNEE